MSMGLATFGLWHKRNSVILPQCDKNDRCPITLESDIDTTILLGRLALGGVIVGTAGLGTGTALVLTQKKLPALPIQKSISLHPRVGSLTLAGAF
jgi:hypothetical protein